MVPTQEERDRAAANAKACREKWAERREAIEARACLCDDCWTPKGTQHLVSPDCPVHGRAALAASDIDETEDGVRGGQGRLARNLSFSASVVLYVAGAFALLAIYAGLRKAGIL